MNDTSLAVIEPPHGAIVPLENPGTLMRHATDVAGVCREIVLKTASTIQGRKFVRVEGWQSIATAHGCCLSVESIEEDEQGNVSAWAAVRRMNDGAILARAQGFVGIDEKTWGKRDRYARRAMCQTRAMSRVARSAFAHVVVLIDANLSTTPAEEVPDGGFEEAKPVQREMPHLKPVTTPLAPAPTSSPFKSDRERTAWLGAHMLKCKLKLVSDLERGDPPLAVEFMQKAGHLLPTESAISEANELTLFPSVPQAPGEHETDGDWKARVNEAVAKDALAIKRAFEEFQGVPMDDMPPKATEKVPPLPDNAQEISGYLKTVTQKPTKKGGRRYGILIVQDMNDREGGEWLNTFDDLDGDLAESLKGERVAACYTEGEYGKDLCKRALRKIV